MAKAYLQSGDSKKRHTVTIKVNKVITKSGPMEAVTKFESAYRLHITTNAKGGTLRKDGPGIDVDVKDGETFIIVIEED